MLITVPALRQKMESLTRTTKRTAVSFEVSRRSLSLDLDLLPLLSRPTRARKQMPNCSLLPSDFQWKMGILYLVFTANLADQTLCFARIAAQVTSSSVASSSARRTAGSPWTTMTAWPPHRGLLAFDESDSEDGEMACKSHFAFARGPEMHEPNSGQNEPNEPQNSISTDNAEVTESHHQMEAVPGELDESRVCLLDTACTACMHSRRWRQAYERHLPPELECQQTSTTKTFHFADGSSAPAIVWRIPILLAGHRGEVLSAEVETGSTPLLLSVTSMESLHRWTCS